MYLFIFQTGAGDSLGDVFLWWIVADIELEKQ